MTQCEPFSLKRPGNLRPPIPRDSASSPDQPRILPMLDSWTAAVTACMSDRSYSWTMATVDSRFPRLPACHACYSKKVKVGVCPCPELRQTDSPVR